MSVYYAENEKMVEYALECNQLNEENREQSRDMISREGNLANNCFPL